MAFYLTFYEVVVCFISIGNTSEMHQYKLLTGNASIRIPVAMLMMSYFLVELNKFKCSFIYKYMPVTWNQIVLGEFTWCNDYLLPETVAQRCSVKKVFLEISQNSQKNTCVRVSFLVKFKPEACSFIEKETLAQVFSCEFCKISKNTLFYRTPAAAASTLSLDKLQRSLRNLKCCIFPCLINSTLWKIGVKL